MIKKRFKSITLPVLMGLISLYFSIFFLLGAMTGYILTNYFARKTKSIKFSLGNYRVHLHHWLCSLVSLSVIFISGIHSSLPLFFLGIGGGIAFQGFYCYNDWHKIISRK